MATVSLENIEEEEKKQMKQDFERFQHQDELDQIIRIFHGLGYICDCDGTNDEQVVCVYDVIRKLITLDNEIEDDYNTQVQDWIHLMGNYFIYPYEIVEIGYLKEQIKKMEIYLLQNELAWDWLIVNQEYNLKPINTELDQQIIKAQQQLELEEQESPK